MLKGIDISQWQGNVDFAKVKSQIDFIILREGYRKTIDPQFLNYVTSCKKYNIPIMVYHFIYTDNATIKENAESTVKNLKAAGLSISDTWIAADLEYDTWKKNKETVTKEKCTSYTKTYLEELSKLGCKKLFIYCNLDYYRNYYDSSIFKTYPLWLAEYKSTPSLTCALQQYSSKGSVSGINGYVDMDYLYNTSMITTKEVKVVSNFDKYYYSSGTHYISNSGSDERGTYHGGAAGDQTGKEWQLRSWYNRPWTCVLRYPDEKVRMKIAELGIKAALNNLIGYDQYQRDTYEQHLKASNNDPSQITVACEADCSAGVCANVRAVGRILGISKLANLTSTYTGNMRNGFKNAGFEVLTDSKYLTSGDYLVPGDILLNDSHHTATNITLGSKAKNTTTTTSTTSSSGNISKTKKFTGITTADLNVRTWAGTENKTVSFSPLKKNTQVDVCDTVKAKDGSSWYYIKYNNKYGFASAKYITQKATTATNTVSSSSLRWTVTISDLRIRTGPGTNYSWTGQYTGKGTFTIVQQQNGWGKLSSGAGWISLNTSYGHAAAASSTSPTSSTATTNKTQTTSTSAAPSYKVGNTYTVVASDLMVRKTPGGALVGYNGLTSNAKQNDKDRDGGLDKGTKVTCQAIQRVGNNIWIKIPSGWICGYYNSEVYVK